MYNVTTAPWQLSLGAGLCRKTKGHVRKRKASGRTAESFHAYVARGKGNKGPPSQLFTTYSEST